ncbi:alpha/beta hydrolase family protein [Bifidobacterium xylocopae]|uniref:Alpha/beta hydrolase n=1 Tax=Bifidobacterium xylocopae TaxID=2493119 RepID=A0A366KDF2_9BIFI|nr:alpha/beta hydrolase [Bifidobacterium xylocopae]RBP99775.1 alpha/beta hydrolase [Bifidobacterium xylocopae]
MRILKRLAALLAAFAVLLCALTGVGYLMTPPWKVEPYHGHLRPATADTAIVSKLGPTVPQGSYRVKESGIKVRLSPDVSVHAIVREPVDAPTGRPACLFIHGAGTGSAANVYGDLAQALASAGITTLVPDKRLDTYTTFHRDYAAMADDYGKSLKILRSWPGVDPAKTGLYAESEGSWVSSVMTGRDPSLAFSILTSPPVYPGRDQMAMAASTYLYSIGAPDGIRSDVTKLLGMDFAPLGLEYADFDALAQWNRLIQPTLINFGVDDPSMPIEQGAQEVMDRARAAGNRNVTVRYYPTNHQMRVGSRLAKAGLPLEPHYTRNLEDWINAVAAGTKTGDWSTPQVAGSRPDQLYAAPNATSPGLVSSLGVLIGLLAAGPALLLLAALGALVLLLARTTRRHRQRNRDKDPRFASGVSPCLWAGAVGGLLLLGGTLGYVTVVVVHALGLNPLSRVQNSLWIALKVLALLLTLVCAIMPGHVLLARLSRHSSRSDAILAGAGHVRPQSASPLDPEPILARGWGHWLVLILAWAGTLACLLSLAFWGLFSL